MRIVLLSDTHGFLDDALVASCRDCDEIWHAGDFGTAEVLDVLKEIGTVRAVFGNVDGAEVRSQVPEDLEWECEGVTVFMTHIARKGPRRDLSIAGHSHILKVARDERGTLHMNPGACGHHGWHQKRTLLRFTLSSGKISGVEAVELGPRGRKKS